MDTREQLGTASSGDRPDPSQQPPGPEAMPDRRPVVSTRWPPWWIYLVVLLGANHLRAGLMPVGTVPEPVVVVIALVQAAALFTIVTAAWRYMRRGRR